MPLGPKSVTCHICGREFGTASIGIHIPKCEKKWEDQERLKPPHHRRPCPQAPQVDPRNPNYNEAARQRWDEEALLPCPNCGRTFLPDRLEIHMRSCQPKDGGPRSSPMRSARSPNRARSPSPRGVSPGRRGVPAPMQRPKTVTCHICGRDFGTASIDIHVPQCEKKWEAEQLRKPPHHRRPIPRKPEPTPGMSTEEYNEASLQRWNDEALVACPNCGRTFLPDRLEKHMMGCKSKDGGMPVSPAPAPVPAPARPRMPSPRRAPARSPAARPKTVVCHICGREFGTSSIEIHLPQCQKKWEAQEALKPPRMRRPVPRAPEKLDGMTTEEFNECAAERWNSEVLIPCPNCGRTFLPDRLEKHMMGCHSKDGGPPIDPASVRATSPTASAAMRSERMSNIGPDSRPPGCGPVGGMPVRPKTVTCHICGRDFGSASISIHMKQCEEKWIAQENKKPPNQRRPVPRAPERQPGMSNSEYREVALQTWNDEALLACPNCGRTFLPDRLEIHMRSCRPKDGAIGAASGYPASDTASMTSTTASVASTTRIRPSPSPPPKPRTVTCHICGRDFGTASIDIHIPKCQKKWEDTEARKPPEQRRPVPRAPEQTPGMDRGAYNEAALQQWNDEALLACPNCGRTFLPDRLEVHLRSCRPKEVAEEEPAAESLSPPISPKMCPPCAPKAVPKSPSRRSLGKKTAAPPPTKQWNDEALVGCPNCKRTFLPDRLAVHLRSCRPKAPKEGEAPEEGEAPQAEEYPEEEEEQELAGAESVLQLCADEFVSEQGLQLCADEFVSGQM